MHARCRAVPVFVLISCGVILGLSPTEAARPSAAPIHLRVTGPFDPAKGEARVPGDASLEAAAREFDRAEPKQKGLGHYIVQFQGPIQPAWKSAIWLQGGRILRYVPHNAFSVRMPRARVARLRRAPNVRAVVPYHPHYAISPAFNRRRGNAAVNVLTFLPSDLDGVARRVRGLGGTVVDRSDSGAAMLRALVPVSTLRALARTFGVSWIEPTPVRRLYNNVAADITNVDTARTSVGLYGANQVVAVADTGLDTGDDASVGLGVTAGTLHPDVRGRVLAAEIWGNRGTWNDPDGHGTHVAGSVLGNGVMSGSSPTTLSYPAGSFAGPAPEAQLVMQSFVNANGALASLGDIYSLFQSAYDIGARTHSDSWGHLTNGEYDFDCYTLDRFMWDHPDMLLCFAAGNDGVDANANGVIDLDSMGSPSVAKNCLSVGASENSRPAIAWSWSTLFGYTTNPVRDDLIANNALGMAAFSSRGPCDDNRIRPDICAPGTFIASMRTQVRPINDNVETAGNWSVAAGAGVQSWVRNGGNSGTHSGSNVWHCHQQNTSGAPGSTTLTQTVNATVPESLTLSFFVKCNTNDSNLLRVEYSTTGSGGPFSPVQDLQGTTSGSWLEFVYSGFPASSALAFRFTFFQANGTDTTVFADIDDIQVYPTASRLAHGPGAITTSLSPVDENYIYLSGTSMACPHAAGTSALVRQYLQEVRGHVEPSSALVKAILLAGAQDMAPGQYGEGATQEMAARPNNVEGWGRIDLQKSLAPQTLGGAPNTRLLFTDVKNGLAVGESDSYSFTITAGTPLNVFLVYNDRPGDPSVVPQLINDLSLTLTGPPGTFRGNGAGVGGDTTNNVEGINLTAVQASAGTYTVTISAPNVPEGPQPYALVIYGGNPAFTSALQVHPSTAAARRSQKVQFTATFNGIPTPGATWSVVSGGGSISASGLYTAPSSGTSATIRASYGGQTSDAVVALSATGIGQVVFGFSHNRPADLTTCIIGCGPDPLNPLFSQSFDITGIPAGSWLVSDDLDAAGNAFLPPGSTTPWFIRMVDTASGAGAWAIDEFFVLFNDRIYTWTTNQRVFSDLTEGRGWIDTAPPTVSMTGLTDGEVVSGVRAIGATATDNDRIERVELYEDDRLIGVDLVSPYSVSWDTTRATNGRHRVVVRAYDEAANVKEDQREAVTSNGGTRPNVLSSVGAWSFNSTTRVLTATVTLNNNGSASAFRTTLQRLTLFGQGTSFSGFRRIYMQPVTGVPLPRNAGTLTTGASVNIDVSTVLPPEINSVPRWTTAGYYFDAASGGNGFNL